MRSDPEEIAGPCGAGADSICRARAGCSLGASADVGYLGLEAPPLAASECPSELGTGLRLTRYVDPEELTEAVLPLRSFALALAAAAEAEWDCDDDEGDDDSEGDDALLPMEAEADAEAATGAKEAEADAGADPIAAAGEAGEVGDADADAGPCT